MGCKDTALGQRVSMPLGFRPHDQHRQLQIMADRVDGVAEDQILQSAMAVRAHDHQVGLDFRGIAHDFLAWARMNA